MRVTLLVLTGQHKGREIPLPETIFLIGRDRKCHLRPHCEEVSKLHCAIAAWAGKVRVRDLKSRNGTLLNDRPIQEESVARDGDQLQVGTLRFAFQINNEGGVQRAAPVEDERELDWLLLASPEPAVLLGETRFCPVEGQAAALEGAQDRGAADAPAVVSNKAVSGGQHLRTYIEGRKRQRSVPPAPPES